MDTVVPPKTRRGYANDAAILENIADDQVRNPQKSVRATIINTGHNDESDIRRLQRKFSENKTQLIEAAEMRASPPSAEPTVPVDHRPTEQPVAKVSLDLRSVHDIARNILGNDIEMLGRTATVVEQLRLARSPVYRTRLDEIVRNAKALNSLGVVDRITRQMDLIARTTHVYPPQKFLSDMKLLAESWRISALLGNSPKDTP
jgi:hypothetical protein